MTGRQERLSAVQVREAGLDEWRQILGRIKARFRTGDLASGSALVGEITEAALEAGAHPEITLTSADVVVALSSPEAGGVTWSDVELARRISEVAARLDVTADPAGLTQLELGLDTDAAEQLAPFYAALLGSELVHGEPVDPTGQVPTVWWQHRGETDEALALPPSSVEQRWHFDVWVPHDEAEDRLRAVTDAGGRLVSAAGAPAYWVVEDGEGNRHCICTPAGR